MRDALADLCTHARVSVIAERPGSHRQMSDFMAAEGRDLLKQPDIVLADFDGAHSFTLIDVKVTAVAAPSYADHSALTPLHRHRQLERMGLVDYFGGTEQQPGAPPRRMRLVTFVVSEFGSFGEQAAALVRALASRVGRSVPSSLIDESSWATPSFAPFLRSAIAFEVRRRTAVLLRDGVTSDEAFELRSAWDIAQMARAAADAAGDAACSSPAAAPAVAPATAFPVLPLVYAAAVSPTPTDAPSLSPPTSPPPLAQELQPVLQPLASPPHDPAFDPDALISFSPSSPLDPASFDAHAAE